MANVTYLLGAGASYYALPIVDKFEKTIQKVMTKLKEDYGGPKTIIFQDEAENFEKALADLDFLLNGVKDHASVDTFARMFYLTEKTSNYERVKCAIILFFELYYYYFREVDKRYDAFLASILKIERPRLPIHINIISWNYDYEIERAYMKYMPGAQSPEEAYKEMQVLHKGNTTTTNKIEFQLVKLNGTSGYFNKDYDNEISLGLGIDSHFIYDKWPQKPPAFSVLYAIIERHRKHNWGIGTKVKAAISFAWEEQARNEVVTRAKEILLKTDSIVVVGYSFPYFNRFIDRELFSVIENEANKMKRIYVQDPDAENIVRSIKSIVPSYHEDYVRAIPLPNLKQFYMPYELD